MSNPIQVQVAGLAIVALSTYWARQVNEHVPEPYLDEVFHVPQAQSYCLDKYAEWDDKITTPPGLYFFSRILSGWKVTIRKFRGVQASAIDDICDAATLRRHNILPIVMVFTAAYWCRFNIERRLRAERKIQPAPRHWYALQTAFNICIFPVLFFFSGLYYTDVVATALALLAYNNHLNRTGSKTHSILSDALTILIGLVALFMRQSNIFWVAVYLGGLEAAHAIRTLEPPEQTVFPAANTVEEYVEIFFSRASVGDVYDPPLSQAWPHDLFLCVVSTVVAVLFHPLKVGRQIWPYLAIVGAFWAFVAWNGSVVLGDKSNHEATLHLPQMLYIWPLFAFFSAPLFVPVVFGWLKSLVSPAPRDESGDEDLPIALRIFAVPKFYLPPLVLLALGGAFAIVHFDTIIHPFTLADNRHYMFYVFRYTILRSDLVRDSLAVAYVACFALCWGALSLSSQKGAASATQAKPHPTSESIHSSTAILLLFATTLSLVTAPLVEPRYFILPWIFWRLLVPAWRPSGAPSAPKKKGGKPVETFAQRVDVRALLELIWFLAINVGTMYMFLYRPFLWRDEEGNVMDEGRLQRFMW